MKTQLGGALGGGVQWGWLRLVGSAEAGDVEVCAFEVVVRSSARRVLWSGTRPSLGDEGRL